MSDRINTTDRGLLEVVLEAHTHGFTVKNDFARKHAEYVAMAASLGLITTRLYGNVYSSEWRPTVQGLAFLNEKGEDLATEDND